MQLNSTNEVRVLSQDELNKIYDQLRKTKQRERLEIMVRLDMITGMRIGELQSLTINDVYDFNTFQVRREVALQRRHVKGGKKEKDPAHSRTLSLNSKDDKLREYLLKYIMLRRRQQGGVLHPTDKLFATKTGKAVCRSQATNELKDLFDAAGISHGRGDAWHVLRKTSASRIYEAKQDLVYVAAFLGHRNTLVTMRYLGLNLNILHELNAHFEA